MMVTEPGLDLADLPLGCDTDARLDPMLNKVGFMLARGVRDGVIDVVMPGRPALANPR